MDKEKHLFIFSAAWCNPCRMMKAFVWDDPSVKEKLNSFTSVNFIDIDDTNNRDIVMQYRVSAIPMVYICLLYTSPSPRDGLLSRMPSSA